MTYHLTPSEAAISELMRTRPGTVECDEVGCDYVDHPAWVTLHKRSSHPETRTGFCSECGGKGLMIVGDDGQLYHRSGSQCDDEVVRRNEERMFLAGHDF